jgi:site-specific recombinase
MTASAAFAALHMLQPGDPESALAGLGRLMAALRELARRGEPPIAQLSGLLAEEPGYARRLAEALLSVVGARVFQAVHTDAGIGYQDGAFTRVKRALGQRWLPPVEPEAGEWLRRIFADPDAGWLAQVPATHWQDLAARLEAAVATPGRAHEAGHAWSDRIATAIRTLAARLAGEGTDAELVRNAPDLLARESPFLALVGAATRLLERHQDWLAGRRPQREDSGAVHRLIDECHQVLSRVRQQALQDGTSIRLTHLLRRLQRMLTRLAWLVDVIDDTAERRTRAVVGLLGDYADAARRHGRAGVVLSDALDVLAVRIVDNASHHGEHYAAQSRAEWLAMFRAAAIGGWVIAAMALCKVGITALHLAPLNHAFLVSLNYGLGFVVIHLIGGAVATKQPSMTAALLARTLGDAGGQRFVELSRLTESICRTQLIAIAGNVLVAMPVSLAIWWAWTAATGASPVPLEKARVMTDELSPFGSLALPHAALAGACLFLAGLISGFFDNQAAYRRLGARLRAHPGLRRRLEPARLQRLANYLDAHWGSLWGNLLFGFLLGGVATLGVLFGLPLDIRHVAFGSANFVYGGLTLAAEMPWWQWLVNGLGVLLIGAVNLAVSFSLALWLALRARGVGVNAATKSLAQAVAQRWREHRRGFFLPPQDPGPP